MLVRGGCFDPDKARLLLGMLVVGCAQSPVIRHQFWVFGGCPDHPVSRRPGARRCPVHAREVTIGRTFAVAFEHGEDFFATLETFCEQHGVMAGYLPMFIAGFSTADVVGTCEALPDPQAPVWSRVHLRNVEAFGAGTLARDPDTGLLLPHIHATLGLKEHSATGHTSHLLAATVQFLTEMVVVEVTAPTLTRVRNPDLYDVPLLTFGT